MKEREEKIIGKKEVKTIYKEDNSKITYLKRKIKNDQNWKS